jgi:hypothetical protein
VSDMEKEAHRRVRERRLIESIQMISASDKSAGFN